MDEEREPKRGTIIVTGFTMLLLTMALIVFSEQGYHATVAAMRLFFDVVFPSLLPFFIFSDVLLSTGTVHYLGGLFEPLMSLVQRPRDWIVCVFDGTCRRLSDGCGAHRQVS